MGACARHERRAAALLVRLTGVPSLWPCPALVVPWYALLGRRARRTLPLPLSLAPSFGRCPCESTSSSSHTHPPLCLSPPRPRRAARRTTAPNAALLRKRDRKAPSGPRHRKSSPFADLPRTGLSAAEYVRTQYAVAMQHDGNQPHDACRRSVQTTAIPVCVCLVWSLHAGDPGAPAGCRNRPWL